MPRSRAPSIAPGTFFVAQPWVDCITNMPGFNLRQAQEALPVARAIENAFSHDPFATIVWAQGVFRVTNYTLESLENELEKCDFAVAIAHPDDQTHVRDEDWPTPRDNVIFELGFLHGAAWSKPRHSDGTAR